MLLIETCQDILRSLFFASFLYIFLHYERSTIKTALGIFFSIVCTSCIQIYLNYNLAKLVIESTINYDKLTTFQIEFKYIAQPLPSSSMYFCSESLRLTSCRSNLLLGSFDIISKSVFLRMGLSAVFLTLYSSMIK